MSGMLTTRAAHWLSVLSAVRLYHGTGISVSIPGVRNSKTSTKIALRTHKA